MDVLIVIPFRMILLNCGSTVMLCLHKVYIPIYLLLLLYQHAHAGSNALACAGLEQLAMNTDPRAFSKCFRDSSCSKLICQTNGSLTRQLDTFTITLRPCSTPPGVTIKFAKGGEPFLTQMISRPTLVNSTIGSATLEADIFVNSTGSTIGISVSVHV